MHSFDEIDREILDLLQEDASIGMDELAKKVGLTRNPCWRRVKQLEESNVIRKRVALLNPASVGSDLNIFVLIKVQNHETDWSRKFAEAVNKISEIVGAYRMAGEIDYVLRACVSSIKDYDRIYKDLIRQVPILDISASFVMDDIKHTTALPIQTLCSTQMNSLSDKGKREKLARKAGVKHSKNGRF